MTREEAINILDRRTTIPGDGFTWEQINEAIDMAIAALTPIRQEQVEKAWKSEWKPIERLWKYSHQWQCSRCGHPTLTDQKQFCDNCGAPMTDEAVQMVMERLEATK